MTKTHQKLSLLTFLIALLFSNTVKIYAQNDFGIHPIPQKITQNNGWIEVPQSANLLFSNSIDLINKEKLSSLFKTDKNQSFTIKVGIKGDANVKHLKKQIPAQAEAYYLHIDKKEITLAANDQRGIYYGILSLEQLLKDNKLPLASIQDWPDITYRGVVEGFYGEPWSFEKRMDQIAFYGNNKLNTYIYGPKDDPYHRSPNWREPYPQAEANHIKQLVEQSHKYKVDFVWAIHPGLDIKWTTEDRDHLISKFENMYQLGVRSFAVFFDDISGEGVNAEKQAELLNYVDKNFIQKKKDVGRLVMCPTEYNKSWTNIEGGYLPTLGKKLNKTVEIMWTGDRVISEITNDGVNWVNSHIRRPAYIWWNFPVSDYVRDRMLVGKVYGNSCTIANDLSGFVSNPMEHAEASKIAIHQVASYAWNMAQYGKDTENPNKEWEEAIKSVMPKNFEALYTFAKHCSDLGPNGHGFRREESVEIQPVIETSLEEIKNNQLQSTSLDLLKEEFSTLISATDQLLMSDENPSLMEEITPWVIQLRNVGSTGIATLRMVDAYKVGDKAKFVDCYKHINALKKAYYVNDHTFNQNPYQPGVKAGTLVLIPFIDQVYTHLVSAFNKANGTDLEIDLNYCPYSINSDIDQIKNINLQVKNNKIILPRVLEVVKWNKDKQLTFVLDQVSKLQQLEFNIKANETAQDWLRVEVSADNQNWTTVSYQSSKDVVRVSLENKEAQYVRLTNTKEDKQLHINGINLTIIQ